MRFRSFKLSEQEHTVTRLCPACDGAGLLFAGALGRRGLARCRRCGSAYAIDWTSQLAGDEQYHPGNDSYYEEMEADPGRRQASALTVSRIHELLDALERQAPERSLLDVGCGRGDLVEVATVRGWNALGVDLAPGAIRIAKSRGARCEQLDFFGDEVGSTRYGVVIMSEFLEHVPNAPRFLRRAHDLLVPGGILYLTTPNFDSFGRRLLQANWSPINPGHIVLYTESSLRWIVAQTGFVVHQLYSKNITVEPLARLVRAVRRYSSRSDAPVVTPDRATVGKIDVTTAVRNAVYGSRVLRAAKEAMDPLVALAGIGETLCATLRKPG